jgi:diguanylate cyclase (GGDEF)-like protein
MMEELQSLSLVDELTGIYNRRGFYWIARQQLKTARRMELGMYCLFIDVDGLKKINDILGHQLGDEALADTARILKETFRESDVIGRLGGDEFAVLVMEAKENSDRAIISRLGERIAQTNAQSKKPYLISLSVGIYHCEPKSNESIDDLVKRSDALMYEDKKAKRK